MTCEGAQNGETQGNQMQPFPPVDRIEETVLALLQSKTDSDACEALGIHRTTLFRWKKNPHLQRLYREARRDLYETNISQLQTGTSEAIQTLRAIVGDKDAQDSARVSAARVILDQAAKHFEREALEDRIRLLEKIIEKRK